MTDWLLLTATLPTRPSALRVRVWRSLKAAGAGMLREGVYLLPATAPAAPTLREAEQAIRGAGAEAHLLNLQARDDAQERSFRALFDRSAPCAELLQSIKEARGRIGSAGEAELRRTLRTLDQQWQALRAGDFFPGRPSERTAAALAALRRDIERHLSPGEPGPRRAEIAARSRADHQGRVWATRKRPWVDRLATAWLVSRFVDRRPRFLWLDNPKKCPKHALGFDFDGATFSHVDERVSVEVMAHSFGLDTDPALVQLGRLVHCIDVGGIPLDAAAGVETVVRGLQALHPDDDDALLAAALPVFDALYAAMKVSG